MRCDCCDKILTDYEATLRAVSTNDFTNTCLKCLEGLGISVRGNPNLKNKRDEQNEDPPQDETSLFGDLPLDFGSVDWEEDF